MQEIPKVDVPEGESGDWKIRRVVVEDNPIARFRIRHFQPGTYTQLHHKQRGLIMSDTPAERYDHMGFYYMAKGHVLIGGLGIGMCVNACLRKPEVERVTVLEISPDVIKLVEPHYRCDRLEVIEADAFQWSPPKGQRYGAVWFDIWDTICTDNLPEMAHFNRRYARRADWYGCWSQEMCQRERRKNRKEEKYYDALRSLRSRLRAEA